MRLILGYESGGKGRARISFYISGAPPPHFRHASHPLHLQSLKLQLHVVQCTIHPRPLTLPPLRLRVPEPPSPRWKTFPLSPLRGTRLELPRRSLLPLSSLSPTYTYATLSTKPARDLTSPQSNSLSSTITSSPACLTARRFSSPFPAPPSTRSRP